MALKVLILGVNWFIGNSLNEHILQNKDWEVYGMDMASDKWVAMSPSVNS